jgi:hypothetical protein
MAIHCRAVKNSLRGTISKQSKHVRYYENLFRREVNTFIQKNLNIEVKQSKLILECESNEAK